MGGLDSVKCLNEGVQQRPMLEGLKSVYLKQKPGNKLLKSASKFSEKEKNDIHLRRIEKFTNKNAEKLRQHDVTLKRWNDNVETAQAMCEERLDANVNDQLKSEIEKKQGEDKSITFDSNKNVFFYNNNGKTATFKVIQGSNDKHLLQITITGRLSNDELESRIEEIVNVLRAYGTIEPRELTEEQTSAKRTLKLPNGTKIILPSNMKGKQRANFKVEHNKIRFQGDSYKNDMASVFGEKNIPVNVNEGFSVNEMSNDVWRNDCMRQVKSMISPMVELGVQYVQFLDSKNTKAPVNCLFELLSMNMMLNAVVGSQNKQDPKMVLKVAGELSVAIQGDNKNAFKSWKTTLESIHAAYDKFTKDIENLTSKDKTITTFIAEEAVLRRHEELLRELFIEAANRASDVLNIDISSEKGNIEILSKKEIADMDFSRTSGIMSNVIKMFDEQHNKKQQALESNKKEQERDNKIKELIHQIDTKKEASNQQIEGLKGQIGDLKDTIQQQSNKIDELNRTIVQNAEESKQKISVLEKEIQPLDNISNETNEEINKLTNEIQGLENQIKGLTEKLEQLMVGSDSNATMFNPVGSMGSVGYYSMQPMGDYMNNRVKELEKLCEEQQETIKRLEAEVNRLKIDHEELDRLRAEHDASMSHLDNLEEFFDEDDNLFEEIRKEDEERKRLSDQNEEKANSVVGELEALLDV